MGRKHVIKTLLQDIAHDAAPAETIALGPGIRGKAIEMKNETTRVHRGWRLAGGAIVIAGLLAGLLMAVPTTRAAIDDLLRRMGIHLAPEQETNNTTVVMAEPALTGTPAALENLSIDELRARIPFAVRTPGWLPDGLDYQRGLANNKGGDANLEAVLTYGKVGDDTDTGTLTLEITPGDLPPYYLSEKAAQDVTVNGQGGVYIHGGWMTDKPVQPGESSQGLFWDSANDDAYLSWVEDGLAYRLQAHGLGLGLDELTKIAESLK
jgi:hypothetical protein